MHHPSQPSLRLALLTALLLVALALAGCHEDATDDGGDGDPTDTEEPGDGDGDGDGNQTVSALAWAEHPEHGSILTDGEGMTVYVFDNDDPGVSNCYDECAANWPPVYADEVPQAPADAGNLTLIERTNETMTQVALDDRPLYYFFQDEEPGDANGEGAGDVWWIVRQQQA